MAILIHDMLSGDAWVKGNVQQVRDFIAYKSPEDLEYYRFMEIDNATVWPEFITSLRPRCRLCQRRPDEISEYVSRVEEGEFPNADRCVIEDEGTFNPRTMQFLCTSCYITEGMPLGKA